MLRKLLFQLHWLLGITFGCVLVVTSVTGVMLSFEDEIMTAASRDIVSVAAPADTLALSPDALLQRIREQRPDRRIATLVVAEQPGASARVVFARMGPDDDDRRSYVDPYTGTLLGPARAQGFFGAVRDLHRWLLLPGRGDGPGRQITGIACFALIYFALSGLYLRWPRRASDWRQWFVIDRRLVGRAFPRALHAVIGTWLILFYLLSGLTGLWWSYDWYKAGVIRTLTGAWPAAKADKAMAGPNARAKEPQALSGDLLTNARVTIKAGVGGPYAEFAFTIPRGSEPMRVRALPADARHDQAWDEFTIAPADGRIVRQTLYAEKPLGVAMTDSWLAVHTGAFAGMAGRIAMLLSTALLPLFAVTGWLLYLHRRRMKKLRISSKPERNRDKVESAAGLSRT